jgi:hypothetical protein
MRFPGGAGPLARAEPPGSASFASKAAVALCLFAALSCPSSQAATPVLVELFTSEGCSSCPPADALLAKLQREQPVEGVQVIVLSEHVDYWDRLGWRDPFSSNLFTRRQEDYSLVLPGGGPYTPEMVVDGAEGFVGSEAGHALGAIRQAARKRKASIGITRAGGRVSVKVESVPKSSEVLLAITEGNLLSPVASGENAGRKLPHTAVVRLLRSIGKAKPGAAFTAEESVTVVKGWKPQDLRVVVFLQERSSRRVLGAAEAPLSTP